MKRSDIFLPAAICWSLVSTILLTLPGSAFPKETWLDKIWADKWVHIVMFSLLTVLWCLSWLSWKKTIPARQWKKVCILIGITWLAYGIMIEFVQQNFVANRSFDPGDIVADAVGCAVGVIFSTSRYIKK